jgi:hypothetical protein
MKGHCGERLPLDATIDDEVEYELKPRVNRVVVVQAIEPARHRLGR